MARKKHAIDTYAITALITVLSLATLAYGLVQHARREDRLDRAQTAESGGWKAYDDAASGLHFEYPSSYHVSEYPDTVDGSHKIIILSSQPDIATQTDGSPAISFDVFLNALAEKNATPIQWMKTHNVSNFNLSDGTYHKVNTGEKEIITYRWSGLYNGISTLFTKDNTIMIASVTYDSLSDAIVEDFESIAKTISVR